MKKIRLLVTIEVNDENIISTDKPEVKIICDPEKKASEYVDSMLDRSLEKYERHIMMACSKFNGYDLLNAYLAGAEIYTK